jgi:hypothetical protein
MKDCHIIYTMNTLAQNEAPHGFIYHFTIAEVFPLRSIRDIDFSMGHVLACTLVIRVCRRNVDK